MSRAEPRLGERSLFPDLQSRVYLNHAAISPPSSRVSEAVAAVVDDYARGGLAAFGRWREQREELRTALGRLIGASGDDIALTPNTTRSVVDVALCFPWSPGDRILCFRGEFPTNVTPWQQAAKTFGLEVVFLDANGFRGERGWTELETELRRGVRLVAVSAVQFQTGLRMPIEDIARRAREHGAEVFVDAIQAVGIVPLDVQRLDIDYLACGSHKWLMALEGAGFLWMKPGRAAALIPRVAGWLSHASPLTFLFEGGGHLRYDRPIRTEPSFLESGAMNTVGFAALGASVSCLEAVGVESIFEHVQRYHDACEAALLARGFVSHRSLAPAGRSGILSVVPPDGVEIALLWKALNARGIACTMPDGNLRLAPHWPNALTEVPLVVEALDEALEEVRR